jgi:predicted NUDIX family NTP pyrophosphohydrolase
MARESAGLLMYRLRNGELEFLLVHPGGPFWKNKNTGAWTIPKGEIEPGEDALAAAQREFAEELGTRPEGHFIALNPVRQKSGKLVRAWAVEGEFDPAAFKSNTFQMEWPPRSGQLQEFPEIDQAAFFPFEKAKEMINPAQVPMLEEIKQTTKPHEPLSKNP